MATEATGKFLGKSYAKKQFHVAQRQQPAEELTFMGRRYHPLIFPNFNLQPRQCSPPLASVRVFFPISQPLTSQ